MEEAIDVCYLDHTENSSTSGISLYRCQDPKRFKLCIRNHDQVGFLFRLCERLLRYKIEIVDAEIGPLEELMQASLTLRVLDADFAAPARVERWCKDVEKFVANCEKEEPPSPEDPLTLDRLSVSLDLDLLNVTALREIDPHDSDSLSQQNESVDFWYCLEVSCINQTGILGFLSLVAFKSGFNIKRVRCGQPEGKSAWLVFDLTTKLQKAAQVIRSYLDIPFEAFKTSGVSSKNDGSVAFWPPGCSDELRYGTAIGCEEYETIDIGNGDSYVGGILRSPGWTKKQHGFGTYVYKSKGHELFKEYKGQWFEGKKHGHGVLCYKDDSVYVGEWQNGKRHGFGVLHRVNTDDPKKESLMPSYSYEGQWLNDVTHGLGAEESADSCYYGGFMNGEQAGRGIKVMLDHNLPIGCEVIEGEHTYSMLEVLEYGIDDVLKSRTNTCIPHVKSLPQVMQDMACSLDEQLESTAPSESSNGATSELVYQLRENSQRLKLASTPASSVGSHFPPSPSCARSILPTLSSLSSLERLPSPRNNQAWLGLPRDVPKASPGGVPRYASPTSVAWMASPTRRTTIPTKHVPLATPNLGSLSAPVSPANSVGELEFRMEILEVDGAQVGVKNKSPASYDQNNCHCHKLCRSYHDQADRRREDATDWKQLQHILQTSTVEHRFLEESSASSWMSPPNDPSSPSSPPVTVERKASARRPILGPMLWSEDELAIFLRCVGLTEDIARNVQQCSLKGVDHLIKMSDSDLSQKFGMSSIADVVVMRKALKRFLKLDRVLSRTRPAHSRDDPNLRDFIISLEDLDFGGDAIEVGSGGFGHVYKGNLKLRSDSGRLETRLVAAKEMKSDFSTFLKEGRIMAKLSHKNICQFIGICTDLNPNRNDNSNQYIVSELMDCSLYDLLHGTSTWTGELTIPLVLRLSAGICAGIMYLHGNKLVHADLKPQNILINEHSRDSLCPKICDFGHVAMRVNPSPHHLIGTPHWAAPEALRQEDLSSAADIYSIGVILWEMLVCLPGTGQYPFKGYSYAQLVGMVGWAGALPDMSLLPPIQHDLRCLLLHCLAFWPEDRPYAKSVRMELRQMRKSEEFKALSLVQDFVATWH